VTFGQTGFVRWFVSRDVIKGAGPVPKNATFLDDFAVIADQRALVELFARLAPLFK